MDSRKGYHQEPIVDLNKFKESLITLRGTFLLLCENPAMEHFPPVNSDSFSIYIQEVVD